MRGLSTADIVDNQFSILKREYVIAAHLVSSTNMDALDPVSACGVAVCMTSLEEGIPVKRYVSD